MEGVTTNMAAHLRILEHPDFIAGRHSTRWVEDRLDFSDITPGRPSGGNAGPPMQARPVDVEVDGRRYAVRVWLPESSSSPAGAAAAAAPAAAAPARPRRPSATPAAGPGGGGKVVAPMQGTIVEVLVAVGDTVAAGQGICVLEAMKMENLVESGSAGEVAGGDVLAVIA